MIIKDNKLLFFLQPLAMRSIPVFALLFTQSDDGNAGEMWQKTETMISIRAGYAPIYSDSSLYMYLREYSDLLPCTCCS